MMIRNSSALVVFRKGGAVLSGAVVVSMLACGAVLAAQSPFGVAIPDSTSPADTGPFKSFFLCVSAYQSQFYQAMTGAVKDLKESGTAFWLLMGLGFLYGVFHAAGPGHGKAVLSSYVVASNETARTGAIISFLASLVQAVSAIVIIGFAAILLKATSMAITDTARAFEIGSYALVAVLGVFLVWRKVLKPMVFGLSRFVRRSEPGLALAGVPQAAMQDHAALRTLDAHGHHHHHHGHSHYDHDHHGHGHGHGHGHHGHAHGADGACCHMTGAGTAEAITRSATPLKDALGAILAVGIRPCSGALIILVFTLSQGLFWAGIAATFAMAIGTGLVVALLVTLSVTARNVAVGVAGPGSVAAARVQTGLEALAALFVLFVGVTLLYASLLSPSVF
ncbi:MAG: nickel/cobalt transporter [Pseudomonadota bacterium]